MIMWTGALVPYVVDDPEIYAVVMAHARRPEPHAAARGHGQVLVEQGAGVTGTAATDNRRTDNSKTVWTGYRGR